MRKISVKKTGKEEKPKLKHEAMEAGGIEKNENEE